MTRQRIPSKTTCEVSLSVRLRRDNRNTLGPGKVALLAAIADEGSITAAAKALGMSYRRAWLLVDALNGTFTVPLVHTSHGGRCRGGATLTETGERVLALCRGIERKATQATATDRRVIAKLLLPTHGKKA